MRDTIDQTPLPTPDELRGLYRSMLLVRRFEELIVEVYPEQEMKTPVHMCIGQEAIAAGVCAHLKLGDPLFSTHRNHGHCLAKGMPPEPLYAEFYGRVTGCCRGKGGSMHSCWPEAGIMGTTAIVGGGIPLAVGAALALKLRKAPGVSVVFVCENNGYATNSPLAARQPLRDIHLHAAGYGIPAVAVDGNCALTVHHEAGKAVRRARAGLGPSLLECHTYRWKGHVGPDCDHEKGCRPLSELEHWIGRCPIERLGERLLAEGLADAAWCETLRAQIDRDLRLALDRAKAAPYPDPAEVARHVFRSEVA